MRRAVVAVLLALAFVLQGTTSVLAGTTGSVSGIVVDASTNRPLSGAHVTATSASQTANTATDASGHYTFASLNPDTYTVSVTATATNDTFSVSGITVLADQNVNVTVAAPTHLKTIGSVTSRSASALVKPGTTADVYSINAVTQDKSATFGGGGTLNSAWSAISSVPGVYTAPGQAGYIGAAAAVSIRGGDYDQIGYELDGIPVNRSFDNYPSSALSSLGQQELQVYTGAAPANAEAEGLSGYINQVIRTGTAPGYRSLDLGIGTPTLYNKLAFETGGANPSRTFTYYVGLGAYNQNFRYVDQYDGASLNNTFGAPIEPCSAVPAANYNLATVPSCFDPRTGTDYTNGGQSPAYVLGPYTYGGALYSQVQQRDTVANLHFRLPRKSGDSDDVQVLFDNSHLGNIGVNSPNDAGGVAYLNAIGFGTPTYVDGYQTTIPYGTLLGQNYQGGGVEPYLFPNSPLGRAVGSPIAPNTRDEFVNDQSVFKVQYQRNFGTNAFLRLYGYTYYSDWLNNGPNSSYENYLAFDTSDYQLASHARGLSAQFTDQLTPQHLISLQGSYTTARSFRFNNSGQGHLNGTVGYLVDGNDPGSGTCYTAAGGAVPGCNFAVDPSGNPIPFGHFTLQQALNGTVTPASGTCGTGPCQYLVVGGGPSGSYNTVVPKFYAASITDNWRPTEKLTVNLGVRYDLSQFFGADTTNSIARTLYFNAYNQTHAVPIRNVPSQQFAYPEFQPRLGFTYALNPATVVRGSYGRYAQAPNASFEQYDYLQPNSTGLLGRFVAFGLPNTPGHPVRPEVSNNYDFSLEHQFRGDVSLKATPFLRKTQDQIQQFYLDQRTAFVSGLNVGNQTSQGVELELDKGDFARNGLAGRLAFTYTDSKIRYNREPNGSSIIDPINAAIAQYDGYTKSGGGAACYTPATLDGTGALVAPGAATACGAGTIANPYYNAPSQALFDPNGAYPTFDVFPGGVGTVADTFGAPYVATLLVQYKHGPLAITPAVQFLAGQRFGTPENTPGVQPDLCSAALPGSTTGDPRYNYGSGGPGQPYDATACGNRGIAIPDSSTNRFDSFGAFVAPSQLSLHLQASYDVSKRLTLVGNFANVYTRCFGGNVPRGIAVGGACGYALTAGAGSGPQPFGNAYNPGWALQPFLNMPYNPLFSIGGNGGIGFPFNMYLEARLKL